MTIEQNIFLARAMHFSKHRDYPDTVIINTGSFIELHSKCMQMLGVKSEYDEAARYEYAGMEVIRCNHITPDKIRVCKTIIL